MKGRALLGVAAYGGVERVGHQDRLAPLFGSVVPSFVEPQRLPVEDTMLSR